MHGMCAQRTELAAVEVTRAVELDVDPAEAWDLIGDGEGWAGWMVDEASVEVAPGGGGDVVDDGERRDVRIDDVVDGERVAFTWWPAGQPGSASSVELRIVTAVPATVLEIVETFPARSTVAASVATVRWSVRALCAVALRRLPVAA
jgi:uncharacterized protein YndB with AHSA1/START domain